MAKTGVGLDIGTSSVKVVEVQTQGGNVISINQFGIVPLPEGALNGGVVSDYAGVATAVKEALFKTKISAKKVVVAIAGQSVVVRHIKLPVMTDAELSHAIKWEAERYIPFPIDEVNFDFQVVSRDTSQNEMEVVIVFAHNDIIQSHLETLKQVGVAPHVMDIQPFALMRTFGMETNATNGSIALLDIGAGTSDLTIVKDGVPRFTRIIPVAGTRFTQGISKGLNITTQKADELKVSLSDAMYELRQGSNDDPAYRVNFVMAEGLKELALELRRSFDYYQLQQRNEAISKLVVSGGGSKIKNLGPYLNAQINLPVEIGTPVGRINCNDRIRSEFEKFFPNLAVAYGLAIREVTSA